MLLEFHVNSYVHIFPEFTSNTYIVTYMLAKMLMRNNADVFCTLYTPWIIRKSITPSRRDGNGKTSNELEIMNRRHLCNGLCYRSFMQNDWQVGKRVHESREEGESQLRMIASLQDNVDKDTLSKCVCVCS